MATYLLPRSPALVTTLPMPVQPYRVSAFCVWRLWLA